MALTVMAMAHTAEQRDKLKTPLCGAKRKSGEKCRAFAGQGTDHPGIGACKFHGGAMQPHRTHAALVQAKQRMVKLGAPIDIQPHAALLGTLRATTGHVAWLNAEIGALEDIATHEARVLVQLYDSERDRLVRIAKACSEVGVDQIQIRLAVRNSELMASAVDNALRKLGYSDAKRRELHEAVAQELEELDAAPRETGLPAMFA